jgi:hypothetical protein
MARASGARDHGTSRMKYRHEQMSRAREEREARRVEAQRRVEAAVWSSFTAEEQRLWRLFSDAVADVRPSAG